MAMDWDRSGDDAGAAAWRGRMQRLAVSSDRAALMMVSGIGRAAGDGEKLAAFGASAAHVDAGRIGAGPGACGA